MAILGTIVPYFGGLFLVWVVMKIWKGLIKLW